MYIYIYICCAFIGLDNKPVQLFTVAYLYITTVHAVSYEIYVFLKVTVDL